MCVEKGTESRNGPGLGTGDGHPSKHSFNARGFRTTLRASVGLGQQTACTNGQNPSPWNSTTDHTHSLSKGTPNLGSVVTCEYKFISQHLEWGLRTKPADQDESGHHAYEP